jgi:ABC-2 type transport system permease protein
VAADPAHPSSLIIAFVVPVILLVLFGYGVSLDLERIKVAVVVQEQTRADAGNRLRLRQCALFHRPAHGRSTQGRGFAGAGAIAALVVIDAQQARRARPKRRQKSRR